MSEDVHPYLVYLAVAVIVCFLAFKEYVMRSVSAKHWLSQLLSSESTSTYHDASSSGDADCGDGGGCD